MAHGNIVACVGDSITFGHSIQHPDKDAYPAVLQQLLGNEWRVKNYGANGATAIKNTPELTPYIKRDVYPESLASSPSVVIIMLGTNDSKPAFWNPGAYRRDLLSLINDYQSLPSSPRVYVATPVTSHAELRTPWDVSEANLIDVRKILIDEIRKTTSAEVITMAGMDRLLFVSDGVHPNEQGATAIAHHIFSYLQNRLNTPSRQ
ncbi:GDSL-type esterase/lipase family protein [Endozoicomonas elysicola]|nr:GDSL-type esterase/lipase family protein [Endozoicomonas elysicola]